MSAPLVESVQCNYCSKWRPRFRVHAITNAQTICDHCLEWHLHALDFLGGAMPRGCQVCDRDWETLRDTTPGTQVRMYVVPKDGIYQLLCASCATPYVGKRGDLYRGTQFGEALKIL
jgi:ribosomal protein S26